MGTGVTSTTDMVAINPSKLGRISGIKLAGALIDFADRTSGTGRYGVVGYGLNQSDMSDIVIFNAGADAFHFETFGNGTYPNDGVSYDVTMERTYVRAAKANGYLWYTGNATSQDMDRWTITDAYYHAYNVGATAPGQQLGTAAFHLETAGTSGYNSIQNFTFINAWDDGLVNNSSNAGFWVDQSGVAGPNNYINNVRILGGDIFDHNRNGAVAFKVSSTTNSSGIPGVGNLDLHFQESGFTQSDILNDSVATVWTYSGYPPQVPITDGLAFRNCTVPASTTSFPVGGPVFQSGTGTYLWCMTSDGVIHVVRTDIGPVEEWRFDQAKNQIYPAADKTGSLGIPTNRWERISTVKLDIASVASLKTAAGISDIVKVPGATPSSHCSLTATDASAAANIATTYISVKEANQITVRHAPISGMSYDVVCTAN
jgi:hypothetical protein